MNNLLILTIINRDKKKDEPAQTKAQRRAEKNKDQNGENGEDQADSGDDKAEENGNAADVKLSPKEEEGDDVQWSSDTSKEAVERRRRELLGDGTNQLASLVQNELNISDKPVEEKPKTKGKNHIQLARQLADIIAHVGKKVVALRTCNNFLIHQINGYDIYTNKFNMMCTKHELSQMPLTSWLRS